jgi:peptide/nickel transport system permease protein
VIGRDAADVVMRRLGGAVIGLVALAAVAAPVLAPQAPSAQFADYTNAPPMRIRIVGPDGRWHAPFIHPLRLVDRLERHYVVDRAQRIPLEWFRGGRLVRPAGGEVPLLLLGADSVGRDVFSRLLHGARLSLGVAIAGALGALLIGAILGGLAGYAGGIADESLMRAADFVLVLPAVYVVLALRAVLPLVIEPHDLFWLVSGLLALVGWPYAARGVRAIVAVERHREYAAAARSLGASHLRVLLRHLLPAAGGFLVVQATLLLPSFILAEATLSFIGLGFGEPTPSWGTMLQEVSGSLGLVTGFPWLLSPAVAIAVFVLSVHLVIGPRDSAAVITGLPTRR